MSWRHLSKALLVNSPRKFVQSHATKPKRMKLMEEISAFYYPDSSETPEDPWDVHVKKFRLLILEESRHTIAEAFRKRWKESTYQNGLELDLSFEYIGPGFLQAVFPEVEIKVSDNFSVQDRNDLMRPGAVVELHPAKQGKISVDEILLGTLSHGITLTHRIKKQIRPEMRPEMKAIILYKNANEIPKSGIYRIHPLTSVLSYGRQMEAIQQLKPDLYPDLMSTLPRNTASVAEEFLSSLQKEVEAEASSDTTTPDSCSCVNKACARESTSHFTIPAMNEYQEKASTKFLNASPGSIILVQGCVQFFLKQTSFSAPRLLFCLSFTCTQYSSHFFVEQICSPPGTGKSTMLTATICKFLEEGLAAGRKQPRLMVCAPSNKAVTVLAARYLEAEHMKTSPFRAVMVGDKEKMLSEHRRRFKDIFIYTWVENMVKDLKSICQSDRNKADKSKQIKALEKRLYDGVPERSEQGVQALMQRLLDSVSSLEKGKVDKTVKELTRRLWFLERDIQGVLLQKANVIFCTLSSAGATIVKRTHPADGLIIDEAAAAVEPETYIPMALDPKHIMIVGDPKQLPATIMSQHAKASGLDKSLQERLMLDENLTYTMLDFQYRMRPEISSFPSKTFYEGGISDGANVTSPSYDTPLYRSLVSEQPYSFIQVDGIETKNPSGSFENTIEAEMVVGVLMDLRDLIKRETDDGQAYSPWFSIDRVRVITFYQAQVELISNMLKANGLQQVTVSTVDSSQGSEADLIIISFVRTGKIKGVGFLSDNRRLNVALTRAKHKLICIGNSDCLAELKGRGTTTIRSLAKDAVNREIISDCIVPKGKLVRAKHKNSLPTRACDRRRGQKRDRTPNPYGQKHVKHCKKS
jgi:hypothetical protein